MNLNPNLFLYTDKFYHLTFIYWSSSEYKIHIVWKNLVFINLFNTKWIPEYAWPGMGGEDSCIYIGI